jgi:hypothetical protein
MCGQVKYERIADDHYPTPPEYVDLLAHHIDVTQISVWEPACGEGHISKRLSKLGAYVISTDLVDRGFGTGGIDFLKCPRVPKALLNRGQPAIITNPPYGTLADDFLAAALELAAPVDGLVALFMRNEWDCGDKRTAKFFEHPAYAMKIISTKRPRWIAGSTGSPRHNYAWYVWDFRSVGEDARIKYLHPKNARPITQENATCH